MSQFLKNTAGQYVPITVLDAATGAGKADGVSFAISKDGGAQAAFAGAVDHVGNGQYWLSPTEAETNATVFSITASGAGVVGASVSVYTTTRRVSDLNDIATTAGQTDILAAIAALEGMEPPAGWLHLDYLVEADGQPVAGARCLVTVNGIFAWFAVTGADGRVDLYSPVAEADVWVSAFNFQPVDYPDRETFA